MLKTLVRRLLYRIRGFRTVEELVGRGMVVGAGCDINPDVVLDPSHCWLISLGDRVTIAPRAILLAHDTTTARYIGTRIGRVDLEDDVFVGAGAIILPSVRVGAGSIVGAGAVVTRSVPRGSIVGGNPARVIGSVAEHEKRHQTRLRARPAWPGAGWTLASITPENARIQRQALAEGDGYLSDRLANWDERERSGRP